RPLSRAPRLVFAPPFSRCMPSRWRGNNVVRSIGRHGLAIRQAAPVAALRRIWSHKMRAYCAVRKIRQAADLSGESVGGSSEPVDARDVAGDLAWGLAIGLRLE